MFINMYLYILFLVILHKMSVRVKINGPDQIVANVSHSVSFKLRLLKMHCVFQYNFFFIKIILFNPISHIFIWVKSPQEGLHLTIIGTLFL